MATVFWINDNGGLWSDGSCWSGGNVPTASDVVRFTSAHNGDCLIDSGAYCLEIDCIDNELVDNSGYAGNLNIYKSVLEVTGNSVKFSDSMRLGSVDGLMLFTCSSSATELVCYPNFAFNIEVRSGNSLRIKNEYFNFLGKRIHVSGVGSKFDCETYDVEFTTNVDALIFSCSNLDSSGAHRIPFSFSKFSWINNTGVGAFVIDYMPINSSDKEVIGNFEFRFGDLNIFGGYDVTPLFFGTAPTKNFNRINVLTKGYYIQNCNLKGITATDFYDDTWDLTGFYVGDVGLNVNIDFCSSINVYAKGGAGAELNFNDNVFVTVSGGGTPSRYPLAHDTIIVDNNSFPPFGVKTISYSIRNGLGFLVWPNIDTSALSRSNVRFNSSSGLKFCKSLIVNRFSQITLGGSLFFCGDSDENVMYANGLMMVNLVALVLYSGELQLAGPLVGNNCWISITEGVFKSNNENITCASFSNKEPETLVSYVYLGTSTLTINRFVMLRSVVLTHDLVNGFYVSAGNATIKFEGLGHLSQPAQCLLYGCVVSLVWVDMDRSGVLLNAPLSTVKNFRIDKGCRVRLSNTASPVFNNIIAVGEAGSDIYLESSHVSQRAVFTVTVGVDMDYVHLKNTEVSPANVYSAGEHSVDDGNNVGWVWGGGHQDFYETLSDSVVLFDSDFKSSVKVLKDSPKIIDLVSKSSSKSFVDELELSDEVNKKQFRGLVDGCSLDDSVEKKRTAVVSVVDELVLGDLLGKSFGGSRVLSDGFDLFDSDFRNITRSFFDDVGLVDDVSLFSKKSFSDAVVLDAELVKKPVKLVVDGYSLYDGLGGFVVGKTLVDDVVLFDSGSKDYSKLFFDSVKLSESLGVGRTLILFDRLFLDDVLVKSVGFNVFDELVLEDVVSKGSSVSVGSSVVLDDLVVKKPLKVVSSGFGLDDLLVKSVGKSVVDNFALFDSDFKHTLRVLSNVLGVDDSVFRFVGKSVLDEFLLKEDLVKKGLKNVFSGLSLDEFVSKYVKRSFVDDLELSAWVNKKVSIKPLVDSFSLKDFVVEPILKPEITQMQKDFVTILHDVPMAEYIDWYRVGKFEDEMGRLKRSKKLFNKTIYIILQPLTEKDRNFLERGVNVDSYMKAYAESRYYFKNKRIEIEVGDVFVRSDGQRFMVEQVAGKWGNFKAQVFRKLILRGIDND